MNSPSLLAEIKKLLAPAPEDSLSGLLAQLSGEPITPSQRARENFRRLAHLGLSLLAFPILLICAMLLLAKIAIGTPIDFLIHGSRIAWVKLRAINQPKLPVVISYPPALASALPGSLLMAQLHELAFEATPKPWQSKVNRLGLFRGATELWRQAIRQQHLHDLEQGVIRALDFFCDLESSPVFQTPSPQNLSNCREALRVAFLGSGFPINHLIAWVELHRAIEFLFFGDAPPHRLPPSSEMTSYERDMDRLVGEILERPVSAAKFTVDDGITGAIADMLNYIVDSGLYGPLQARIDALAIEQSAPVPDSAGAEQGEMALTRL